MASRRRPVDLDALVERAEQLVRTNDAVSKAEMKIFRPHLRELTPLLVERGIEVGSTIRRPLTTQLLELAKVCPLPVKGLERKLAGATSREVKVATALLVSGGELVTVVRGTEVALASASAPVLDDAEIRQLLMRATQITKLLKAAQRSRRRVLREDVGGLGATSASREQAPEPRSHDARSAGGANEELVQEIARRVRAVSEPTRVPALLRSMGLTGETGRRALLDGAARGLFELEPESGMGRLSREDAALCPPGPMGTHLSWIHARVQQGARS